MNKTGDTKKRSNGFSFVELMVVIALVGILSAISIPSFLSALPEKRLKAAARNVYADLQRARVLAVKKNKKVTVRFNEAEEYYYIDEDEDGIDWNPGETRGNLSDYGGVVYGKGGAIKNWNKESIDHIVPYQDLSFQPVGTAKNASVYLQYQGGDVCYAITATRHGAIRIRRFNGSSWDDD